MRTVIASAPGKINLALLVGEPTPDGYHPLSSVFEAVSLREYVVVGDMSGAQPNCSLPNASMVKTFLYSEDPVSGDLKFDESATAAFTNFDGPDHLAVRAANLLAHRGQPLHITVHKALPVAGGMAGGSADAAATLVAVNVLNGLGYSTAELATLGATLGADVPACVVGGLALGLGRGDQMTQLSPGSETPAGESRWWVAAFSTVGLSTPQVFQAFDKKLEAGFLGGVPGVSAPGSSMDADLLRGLQLPGSKAGDWLVNDLEPTVFEMRPELLEVGSVMQTLGAHAWMLSGSGPTIVGLASTQEQARLIAEGVEMLPQVQATAVVWGPGVSAQVEPRLPVWATAGSSPSVVTPV